jgi:K+-sensing histidine kinase KdpD
MGETRRWARKPLAAWSLTGSALVVLAAALAAAALFGPLRSRVQHRVDRRFNRARYSAERMLAAFAARLTEELDADAVTEDLARSVHAALGPAHVSIWLSQRPG